MDNYYKILGIENYCSDQSKIKDAYRSQIKFFHPDLGNVSQEIAEEKTKQLNIAYDVLSDLQKKQAYDIQLRNEIEGNRSGSYSNGNTNNGFRYNSSNNYNTYNFYRNPNVNRSTKKSNNAGKIFMGVIIFIFILAMCTNGTSSKNNTSNKNTTSNENVNLSPVLVGNGNILKNPLDERLAPLRVTVPSDGGDFYIYLKDIDNASGKNDMAFYIKSGQSVELDVPLGRYELFYCTGYTWYGEKNKFGPDTIYVKSDTVLNFHIDYENQQYSGYSIDLRTVSYGNMQSKEINANSFPG